MTTSRKLGWAATAVVTGVFLVVTQAQATGGLAGLLHVGETSGLRSQIEAELGPVPLVPRGGHDGQMNFVMALDPLAIPDLGIETGYRYRRILFPALASLGGLLDGEAALIGLTVVAIGGFVLGTVAIADITHVMGWSRWAVLGVLANPGAWLSLRLLTSDSLALGLGLLGLALFVRRRHPAALTALALAALAKDQALLVALALSFWLATRRQWSLAGRYALIPPIPMALWSFVIVLRGEPGFTPRGNLGLPLRGIMESAGRWSQVPQSDAVLSIVTLVIVVTAFALGVRHRRSWLGAQLIVWAVLAVIASSWVWNFGNNVARAFSHLIALVAIGVAASFSIPPDSSEMDAPVQSV